MVAVVLGKMPFMRAPAQFGRLRSFAEKVIDRLGVDEFAWRFWDCRDLGVVFGDVDCFDAELLCELLLVGVVGG